MRTDTSLQQQIQRNFMKFWDIWRMLIVHAVLQKYAIRTTVSRLLAAVPVHLPMILSMHFLWMAALHSDKRGDKRHFLYFDPLSQHILYTGHIWMLTKLLQKIILNLTIFIHGQNQMILYTVYHLCIVFQIQVLHKTQDSLYCTLTSAFIALLIESPVREEVTQIG